MEQCKAVSECEQVYTKIRMDVCRMMVVKWVIDENEFIVYSTGNNDSLWRKYIAQSLRVIGNIA
jgi:hypothetical protein